MKRIISINAPSLSYVPIYASRLLMSKSERGRSVCYHIEGVESGIGDRARLMAVWPYISGI